jgi:ClpP class serine protease
MPNDLSSTVNEYLDSKSADGFLYSGPINRDDADKFVKLIDCRPDRRKNVCLFITTYGGDPNAAYRIGRSLKANYRNGKIIAILGGYCKSAGTLLVLCADELAFGCFGELGPLDTQINKPNEMLGSESGLIFFKH